MTAPSGLEHGDARRCAWYLCRRPLRADAPSSARTCSQRCRQAKWEHERHLRAEERAAQPLRLAYADPPYVGLSRRYYAEHPDFAGEVDHRSLLERLATFDGWALSASSRSERMIWRLLDELGMEARKAVWVRGARQVRSTWPLSAHEVVFYRPARLVPSESPGEDVLVHGARPRLSDPSRVVGLKPWPFCGWLFRSLLRALPGDHLDDLFPGSGGVSAAWATYSEGRPLRSMEDTCSPS